MQVITSIIFVRYEHNVDKTMVLLKIVDVDGEEMGMVK